eukprot:TRINITY_DN1818_c0_g1_i4.p1 TRINITY_DN1818_c0_g1~~TRINITY_DN1818_c0_g1_i4.p1  ORF type:complete len:216 (-),score=29.60 TRINITY_DN1818_c0_g1_i4:218-865(-)
MCIRDSPESEVDQITGDKPDFVDIGSLGREIMEELKPMHEEWAGGVELQSSNAYGLRVYKNGNTLTMHTDHTRTHVISSIMHVDRDLDEPWPIVIEGFDGKTYEVDLQPGEMLFYESAKCNHGRPRPMVGREYTSLFVHYRPRKWDHSVQKAIKAIEQAGTDGTPAPGGWGNRIKPNDGSVPTLRMTGTGMYEPKCKHQWCNLAPVWPPAQKGEL